MDWLPSEPRFQLSYHILSHQYKERIRLKTWVDSSDPAIESITSVWPGANYYEREVFDLFGIRFEGHPNLLPTFFEDDPKAASLGNSFVRKPLLSREGANIELVCGGMTVAEQKGPYGAEGFIRQALASLPDFSSQHPVLGSWLVDHAPCGLSIREDENPITGNTSRFLPHAIL